MRALCTPSAYSHPERNNGFEFRPCTVVKLRLYKVGAQLCKQGSERRNFKFGRAGINEPRFRTKHANAGLVRSPGGSNASCGLSMVAGQPKLGRRLSTEEDRSVLLASLRVPRARRRTG